MTRNDLLSSSAMRASDADRFLNQAEICLREAERTRNQLDKEAWLRLADDWMKLAQGTKDGGE